MLKVKRIWVLVLGIVTCLMVSNVNAQTIVNVEKYSAGKDSTVFAISGKYFGTRGNSHTDRASVAPGFVLIKELHDVKVFGAYNVLTQRSSKILNSGFVHARHNYKFGGAVHSFLFYQLQFNEILLLNKREVMGTGVKWNLLSKDSLRLSLGTGGMYEQEFLNVQKITANDSAETRFYRGAIFGSLVWKAKSYLTLSNVVYYQPRFVDFSDYRLLNDLTLNVKINKLISLVTAISYRYDSRSPESLKDYDLNVGFGLEFKY